MECMSHLDFYDDIIIVKYMAILGAAVNAPPLVVLSSIFTVFFCSPLRTYVHSYDMITQQRMITSSVLLYKPD